MEIEEGICAIQVNGAGGIHILGQDGIIEACTCVVCVNIEVVMLLVSGADGLEAEVLGGRCACDRRDDSRGSQYEKGCEGLHSGG